MTTNSNKPRLIAIDLDGTLLGPTGRVSPRNARALSLAHQHGIEIVIATGRRHSYALGPLSGVNLCPDNALISSNGSIIRSVSATELMHRSHMPLETARWLCDHARDFRSTLVVTFDTTQPGGSEARGALVCETEHELDASINAWMNSNAPFIERVDRIEDALTNDPPIQMMLCGPIQRMRAAERHLSEHPRIAAPGEEPSAETEITLHRTEYPERDLSILDIVPVGISKASALQRLGKIRGVTAAEMMAIGDNWNDLAMLQFVGRSVVMGNAPADLLQLAQHHHWHVAPTNAEDGVALSIAQALGLLIPA